MLVFETEQEAHTEGQRVVGHLAGARMPEIRDGGVALAPVSIQYSSFAQAGPPGASISSTSTPWQLFG